MLQNRYGSFDASGRLYTITDPKTPMPWVNVVCNGRYGFVVSQNGGGFSWLDNSQLNVLTRWDMDMHRDERGRHLYLADLDDGRVWSAAPAPCFPVYDEYRCEHTMGRTTFRTLCAGIRTSWTLAVPPGDAAEVWLVEIHNLSGRPRRLRVSSFFEWCCGVAPDVKREFHRLFFTVTHDPARRAIFATKNMWDVPPRHEREHWNRPWPYVAAHAVGGADCILDVACGDKYRFMGRAGQPSSPAMMTARSPEVGGFGRFGDAAAALGGDLLLEPGQSVKLSYVLAIAPTQDEAAALIDKHRGVRAAQAAIDASESMWKSMLSPTRVATEAFDFDTLNNHWLPYQAISGRLWARTGYYQQSGAFGFRDQLQDSQVWLPLDPSRCREQILLHARHQFVDGTVYHWWHPVVEFGNHTTCSDDYLWLPFVTANYIRETGDTAILSATAPWVDDDKASGILDHCLRSFERAFARHSERGLPLMGACDWNDGLSAVGIEGRGESVWLAFFLVGLLADWSRILEHAGDARRSADFSERKERLVRAINTYAWDGEWYRGATLDSGGWIGSRENREGRVFLNCQTWAILTDSAPRDREDRAWATVRERLLAPMGPLLLEPAYSLPDENIGYITRYAPGLRENGGVYMHAATWALMAACKRRDVDAAAAIWRAISPPLRGADADSYRAEPYVTPGNVDGPCSETPGRAGWTWYTGSAAWLNRVALEWVLGIRPTWDALVIDPCPIPELGSVDVTRRWRGRTVRVRFDASEFDPSAPATLTVNGNIIEGVAVSAGDVPQGQALDVRVTWGSGVKDRRRLQTAAGREVAS